ncbi:hypothetical protein BV455_02935 [Parageobacillus caldoxylosilyticus]|uniref:hypothetical protein n=1 Tax=Saccharococcus caldoxylosilyticus TaxID=81408 RepID=UPI001C4DEE07|nr:hypothetical protein [Parageobacillus caldoxylosilyticus]QXJ39569.1 hypothetical protein BV455_02935 [Parageobacillus caldoxylosilyticus]
MSKKITGKYKCKDCNTVFEWQHIIPNKVTDSNYEVHIISEGIPGLRVIETDENRYPTVATVYCPKCGFLNKLDSDDLKTTK